MDKLMGDTSDEPRWPPRRIAAALGLAILFISGLVADRDGPPVPMPGWAWLEVIAIGLFGTVLTAVLIWARPKNDWDRRVVGRKFLLGSIVSFVAALMLVEGQVRASAISPEIGFVASPYWFIAIAAGLFVLSFPYERALARRFPPGKERSARDAAIAMMPTSTDVLVDGWSKDELQDIIAEFLTRYGLENEVIEAEGEEPIRLSFSQPLSVDEFIFLVNYLHYPISKNLEGRQIAAVGRTRATKGMQFGPTVPLDSPVQFHVPCDDNSYDCVMAQTVAGPFLIDFGARRARKSPDRRQSAAQMALANS